MVPVISRQRYNSLLNCIKSDVYEDDSDMSNESVAMMTHEVCEAKRKVPDNEACSTEQISAEHLNFASLTLSFTGFMMHGELPGTMLCVLLVPLIKDGAGEVSSRDVKGHRRNSAGQSPDRVQQNSEFVHELSGQSVCF